MANLVDLLAKYLVEWPEGAEYARQDYDKEICFLGECSIDKDFFISEMSEDVVFDGAVGTTKVYMKDWLAARDRLHAEIVQDIKVGGTLEAQEFDTDQALWDKVAVAAIGGLTASDIFYNSCMFQYRPDNAAEFASGIADAFMAERAKRLKGGA